MTGKNSKFWEGVRIRAHYPIWANMLPAFLKDIKILIIHFACMYYFACILRTNFLILNFTFLNWRNAIVLAFIMHCDLHRLKLQSYFFISYLFQNLFLPISTLKKMLNVLLTGTNICFDKKIFFCKYFLLDLDSKISLWVLFRL